MDVYGAWTPSRRRQGTREDHRDRRVELAAMADLAARLDWGPSNRQLSGYC